MRKTNRLVLSGIAGVLLCAAVLPGCSANGPCPDLDKAGLTGRCIDAGGERIRVYQAGSGPLPK